MGRTMHVFTFSYLMLAIKLAVGLKCWECSNALSNQECLKKGKIVTCRGTNMVCEDHARHEQHGKVVKIEKRCKQDQACHNNYLQNIRKAYPIQCSVNSPTSVCRCCCAVNECNRNLLTCFAAMHTAQGPKPALPQRYGKCRSYPQPPHRSNMQCRGNLNAGSTCTFRCHHGYQLKGSRLITCTKRLQWSASPPECVRPGCTRPRVPRGGMVLCSNGVNPYSRCRYVCRRGYLLQGQKYTSCSIRRRLGSGVYAFYWNRKPPTCVNVAKCKQPTASRQRELIVRCSENLQIGAQCRFSCTAGYQLVGGRTSSCQKDLTWSGPQPSCRPITCAPIRANPGNGVVDCTNSNQLRSVCRFKCNQGYELKRHASVNCMENPSKPGYGMWSEDNSPVCEKVRCPQLMQPANGEFTCTQQHTMMDIGEVCRFRCHPGYWINGALSLTCENNGAWNGEVPECQPVTCSQLPEPPENGFVTCDFERRSGGLREVNSSCTFTCDANYQLLGEKVTTCLTDEESNGKVGKWSTADPACIRSRCPRLEGPENGQVRCNGPGSRASPVAGTACRFLCAPAYRLTRNNWLTCGNTGEWSGEVPECEPSACALLPDIPANGAMTCNLERDDNRYCTFSCTENYRLSGERVTACLIDEESGRQRWSTAEPTCIRSRCPGLEAPENGQVRCNGPGSSTSPEAGTLCRFVCEPRYLLTGNNVLTCAPDGSWNADVPTCDRIMTCYGDLSKPDNGNMSCSDGNHLGSVCRFVCDDSYDRLGPATVTCTDEGMWDMDLPICRRRRTRVAHDGGCPEMAAVGADTLRTCTDVMMLSYDDDMTSYDGKMMPYDATVASYEDKMTSYDDKMTSYDGDATVATICEYRCEGERTLHHPSHPGLDSVVCHVTNQTWSHRLQPCCAPPCPSTLLADILVIMDSSPQIGVKTWDEMKEFVRSLISQFQIREQGTRVSVLKYSGNPDRSTQIELDKFDSTSRLLEAYDDSMIYEGEGNKLGLTLTYAATVMLGRGNRIAARDVIILISAGNSLDLLAYGILLLQRLNPLIIVIPVKPSSTAGDLRQLRAIVGAPSGGNLLLTDAYREGFSPQARRRLSEQVVARLCADRCRNSETSPPRKL